VYVKESAIKPVHLKGKTIEDSYIRSGGFNNTSLRKRFGMHDKQAAQISKLIKDAIDAGKIKPKDPESVSKKFSLYIPYWA